MTRSLVYFAMCFIAYMVAIHPFLSSADRLCKKNNSDTTCLYAQR